MTAELVAEGMSPYHKRKASISTPDTPEGRAFTRDVIVRVKQLLAGDETPIEENSDD